MIFSIEGERSTFVVGAATLAQRCRRSSEPAVGDRAPMHRVTSVAVQKSASFLRRVRNADF
jgi:hypothetical protein